MVSICYIEYLISDVKFKCVAALVKYVGYLFNISSFVYDLYLWSLFGALYNLLGVSRLQYTSPPPPGPAAGAPPGPTAAAAAPPRQRTTTMPCSILKLTHTILNKYLAPAPHKRINQKNGSPCDTVQKSRRRGNKKGHVTPSAPRALPCTYRLPSGHFPCSRGNHPH